ncbi:hypothetical protein ACR42D_10115 [Desulfovibrio caledoniensis]
MTRRQRSQYLTLHAVRELVQGMAEQTGLEPKTRASLARIRAKATAMLRACGEITEADARYFRECVDKLLAAWSGDGNTRHTPAAFVAIGLTLVADQVAAIPTKAAKVRADFQSLEGMLATLYSHFDPDLKDLAASKEGESIANDYQALVAA